MPNWVENTLNIYGDETKINEIIHLLKNETNVIDFNKVISSNSISQSDLYEWCIKNWGTKWNAQDGEITDKDDEMVQYSFKTAWSPAMPIAKTIAEKFNVSTELLYIGEPFGCNCGMIEFNENGKEIEKKHFDKNGEEFIKNYFGV